MDIRTHRIPNWLVLPFLAAGIVVSGATSGIRGVWRSLEGVGLAVAILGVLCYLRGLGLGDLKLFAAVGAWIGPGQLIYALLATAIAGGVLALGYALWHRSLGNSLDGVGDIIAGLGKSGFRPHPVLNLDHPAAHKMPYALAIAIGTLFSFLHG